MLIIEIIIIRRILQMINFKKKIAIAASFAAIYSGQYVANASPQEELEQVTPSRQVTLGGIVKHNKIQIFTFASKDETTSPAQMRLVCHEWRTIIDSLIDRTDKNKKYVEQHPIWQKFIRMSYGFFGHDAVWNSILNGELIFKPNADNDEGIIRLKVSDLHNPFEGSFDISTCGNTSVGLCISMGLRKGLKAANYKKNEIWLIPRFLVAHKMSSDASYLKEAMEKWPENIPVATVFNWWGFEVNEYYYSNWADFSASSQTNLSALFTDERLVTSLSLAEKKRNEWVITTRSVHDDAMQFSFKLG